MTLSNLLRRGVGLQLEVMPEPSPDELAETLVAFANGDGGTVLLGVDGAGNILGTVQSEQAEGILRAALSQCRPVVRTDWQQIEDRAGTAIALHVARSTELHSLEDGRVLIRTHEGNQPLDGGKISQLAATKASGDFEIESVAGATRVDLDDSVIQDFLERRIGRMGRDLGQSVDEILIGAGALDHQGSPRSPGCCYSAKTPSIISPRAAWSTCASSARSRAAPAASPVTVAARSSTARWRASSSAPGACCCKRCAARRSCAGLQREDKMLYPPFAVREALVNAVCHRDYRLPGRRVEIRQFDDRLEISSPGGLPGYITVDNIVEEHFSRNPRLVNGLFEWGYIEQLGLGIDRMIEEMVAGGHPQPEFRATPYSFTVVLRRGDGVPRRANPEWEGRMNERQIRALQYLQSYGRITNRDYRELCPDVSTETVRLDLTDMVDKGLVMKIGDKKGTYYILK